MRREAAIRSEESSTSVQIGVASQPLSLPQDPTSGPSDQPQMLAPQILSPQMPPPAETLTQAQLQGNVLQDPPSLLPHTHNLNQQTPFLANTTQFSLGYHVHRSVKTNYQGGICQYGKSFG